MTDPSEKEKALAEARARGEEGMEQAADHADRVRADWCNDALAAVRDVAPKMPGEFTFEDLRLKCWQSLPPPPDLRAWGQVARRAIKERIIWPTGRYAPRASGNCTPTMLYTNTAPTSEAGAT